MFHIKSYLLCISQKISTLNIWKQQRSLALSQQNDVFIEKCDGIDDCPEEPTDELDCFCPNGTFTCNCFNTSIPSRERCGIREGCIPMEKVYDGVQNCPDERDDPHVISSQSMQCDDCNNFTLWRFNNVEGCSRLQPGLCDPSTCKGIPSLQCTDQNCTLRDFVCFSPCNNTDIDCRRFFQCKSNQFILASKFCDGFPNCDDGSDEIRNGFGLSCQSSENFIFSCVLPQLNIYDDMTPQCYNEIDVCEVNGCFQCVDGSLMIAYDQVCDGIVNCKDLSDECLCRDNLGMEICLSRFPGQIGALECAGINTDCDEEISSTHITQLKCTANQNVTNSSSNEQNKISCYSKFGMILADRCNMIPECSDFSDECNEDDPCPNAAAFCEDGCRNFYRMGDRYCNGYIDEAFNFLKNDSCERGFDEDEEICPRQFYCIAGKKISISSDLVNDNIRNCDDGSDEKAIFSSELEMIRNVAIRYLIWIIAFVTVAGNAYVITRTTQLIHETQMHEMIRVNHIIILNLAIADFVMGIYLLIISAKSVQFSGRYGSFDLAWRSSDLCTTAGSLAIISSETSVFIMTTLSSFRLVNVLAPIKSLLFPSWPWFLALAFLWLFTCLIAVFPAVFLFSNYFIYQVFLDVPFARNKTLSREQIITVGCRYASLKNSSYNLTSGDWQTVLPAVDVLFPNAVRQIGYYGETSLCMPRFYVDIGDPAAIYSLVIIAINFVSFVYMCLSYVVIYKITTNRPVSNKLVDQQNARMQKKIARLLATDFVCWIPICIIAFAKASLKFGLPNDLYAATIAFLLPVNSALNPLLYSNFFEKLIEKISCCRKKKKSALRNSKATSERKSHQRKHNTE